jgi:hypothetical protein
MRGASSNGGRRTSVPRAPVAPPARGQNPDAQRGHVAKHVPPRWDSRRAHGRWLAVACDPMWSRPGPTEPPSAASATDASIPSRCSGASREGGGTGPRRPTSRPGQPPRGQLHDVGGSRRCSERLSAPPLRYGTAVCAGVPVLPAPCETCFPPPCGGGAPARLTTSGTSVSRSDIPPCAPGPRTASAVSSGTGRPERAGMQQPSHDRRRQADCPPRSPLGQTEGGESPPGSWR